MKVPCSMVNRNAAALTEAQEATAGNAHHLAGWQSVLPTNAAVHKFNAAAGAIVAFRKCVPDPAVQ